MSRLAVGLFVVLAAAVPDRAHAQGIAVIELPITATSFELANAQEAYSNGHVIQVTGASPAHVRALLGVDPGSVRGEAINRTRPRPGTSGAPTLSRIAAHPVLTAVRKGPGGVLHYYVAVAHHPFDRSWKAHYDTWLSRQRGFIVGDAPAPPPSSWTKLWDVTSTYSATTDWGPNLIQLSSQVYRLNVIAADPGNPPTDKYMVTQYLQSQPTFYHQYCHALQCGWYTETRKVSITPGTGPTTLVDNQPADVIGTTDVKFAIGGGITPAGPGGSVGITFDWSQPDVTTQNQSNLTSLVAAWQENMGTDNSALTSPAKTWTDLFGSYNGAVYEVPAGVSGFTLDLNAEAHFYMYTILYDNYNEAATTISLPVTPPVFAINTNSVTMAPGSSSDIALTSLLPNSKGGLSWKIEDDLPSWLSVNQRTGAGATQLTLTVEPNAPLKSSYTLNIDTDPPYAAPSVSSGPLKVLVTVDTPPVSGLLLTGGYVLNQEVLPVSLNQGQVYSQGTFTVTSPMAFTRYGHTATRLPSGDVLIAGGAGKLASTQTADTVLASAEIYSPSTGNYQLVKGAQQCPGVPGCLVSLRTNHTATLLNSGKVLLVGGNAVTNGAAVATAELYDPSTGLFSSTGSLALPRANHSATLLTTGDVLIAGGRSSTDGQGTDTDTAEIYQTSTGRFIAATGKMSTPRSFHAATLLSDGRVLVSGGDLNSPSGGNSLTGADFFLTSSSSFTPVSGSLSVSRESHQATLLADGQVLITGGQIVSSGPDRLPITTPLAVAELFDPAAQTFTSLSGPSTCPGAAGCMTSRRLGHVAVRLPTDQVLLAGGESGLGSAVTVSELYDPAAKAFTASASMAPAAGATWARLERVPSTIQLSISPNPVAKGLPVTFTAVVTSPSSTVPTGTVTFLNGSTTLGTGTLDDKGQATYSTSSLSIQNYSVTAVYSGDNFSQGSTSSVVSLTVGLDTSVTTVTSSNNPANPGDPVSFKANVTAAGGVAGTPTGSVTFRVGESIDTIGLTNGTASSTTSALPPGVFTVTATYSGDASFASSRSDSIQQTINKVPTTTTLIAAPSPSTPGQTVVLTASVAGRPTDIVDGTVTFLDGAGSLGTGTLTSGKASISTTALGDGPHVLTAQYMGTTTYNGSTSSAVALDVLAPATVTLSSSTNPAPPGHTVALTASVSGISGGSPPTGTVTFWDGSTQLGTGTLTNQSATLRSATLASGLHTITAAYSGDKDYSPAVSAPLNQVMLGPTKVTLGSSVNPSPAGQPVIFTATVTPVQESSSTPTGVVVFRDGDSVLGTANVVDGAATYSASALTPGTHVITAAYGGDGTWAPSTSAGVNQVINLVATQTTLQTAPNPSTLGQSVTLAATVTGSSGGSVTGSVTFLFDGAVIGSAPLSGGTAQITKGDLSVGSHSLTARFEGNATYGTSTSASVTQIVAGSVTVTVTSSLNPAPAGATVTLIAAVSGNAGVPSGSVTFLDGTSPLGTSPLSNGSATLNSSTLAPGVHSITVRYAGDSHYSPATSAALNQTIDGYATQTALESSTNPSAPRQPVTFTATVAARPGDNVTGMVSFFDGATLLGSIPLSNGVATFTTAALSVGPHAITARYGGSQQFAASASAALSQVVRTQSSTTTTLTGSSAETNHGEPVTFAVTVQGTGGTPTGTVTFMDGTTRVGAATLSNGSGTWTTSSLSVGNHSITAVYGGDSAFAGSTSAAVAHLVKIVVPPTGTIAPR